MYAPRLSNDRLLLGLKGSHNEYELNLLRQRSLEARREKARRGELIITAPVGYRNSEDQRLEKEPNLRVRKAIRSVFRQFAAIGSVRQTLLWFLEHGLQLPACTPRGEVHWKRPYYGTVYQILTRPVYGGAYACGKTECSIHYKDVEPRKRDQRKPRDQWLALTPNAHEGYVDWDEFEAIQRVIHANARLGGQAGAPKERRGVVVGQ
ncbi:recombinase family protein [Caballeronia sp. LjRoot34]|uniref:recombinase family protein n=1 Tax=Caballeronia sp. LjRoot34 TaxID=3342325 RepID=UPI003ECD2E0E